MAGSNSTDGDVVIDSLSRWFDSPSGRVEVLENMSLTIPQGELVSVIGPSGCGKSTLFNIIAGLDLPSAGTVRYREAEVTGHPEHFAYMPQRDLLMPWLKVLDNAALGLRMTGVSKREARSRARDLLEPFGLSGFEDAWPAQLSGGMRQRVALLRTVLLGRPVLLLDEPFGALDSLTRTEMQHWLMDVWEQFRWTVMLITHDIREAVILSDRVYALTKRPASLFGEYEIRLPRPRSLEMFSDAEAVRLEAELLSVFEPAVGGRLAG